jgi:hypothetical protein
VSTDDKLVRIYTLKEAGAAPAPAKPAPEKKADGPDARQAGEAFFAAAIAGNLEGVKAVGDPAKDWENKVKDFQETGLKAVSVSVALADEVEALVLSEPVEVPKEGKGHILLELRKKDGQWRVRDIDFRSSADALARQRDFLDGHPDAKAVRARK